MEATAGLTCRAPAPAAVPAGRDPEQTGGAVRVFLTGGTGLLGSHVAEQLVTAGHRVVALARAEADTRHLAALGAEVVRGDLADPELPPAALRGCAAVVHAAAIVFRRAPWAEYEALNVAATERVLRSAAAAGVARAVHVSSVAVYGAAPPPVREEAWLDAPIAARNLYARSKREAERAAWRVHGEGAVAVTAVRPAVLHGERDRIFTPWLDRLTRLPLVPLPGGGRTTVPVVYAGNVAAAIVRVLERPATAGRAYNLALDRPLTARELLTWFAATQGRRPRFLAMPGRPLVAAASLIDGLLDRVGLGAPGLGRGARLVARDNPYDPSRALAELGDWGMTAPVEALARTGAWWRARS
jgi:2-alkyl-3-oxoalkanoate reductase